ncbi:MAG: SecDF P1 head subdomain-containing protein [Planctomycetota bacterium]
MVGPTTTVSRLVAAIILLSPAGWADGQQETGKNDWTMEFRIAADPKEDSGVVETAKSGETQKVSKEGKVVAKWVEVLKSAEEILGTDPNLVTRHNRKGRLELLVLVDAHDVTESDVRRISPDINRYGQLALGIVFNKKGARKLFNRTASMLAYGKPNRYMAQIMDNKVYATPVILSPVSGRALITGKISQTLIDDISRRTKRGLVVKVWHESEMPYYYMTPLRVFLLLAGISIIVAGSFPAKDLRKSRYAQTWIVIGIAVGAIIGAYQLGVSVTYGTADIGGGLSVIEERTHISLLWAFVGCIIGGGFGFSAGLLCRFFVRRAIYNIGKLVCKRRNGIA